MTDEQREELERMAENARDLELAQRDLIHFQDRIIGRLRAVLLSKGMTAKEVTRIAADDDFSPNYEPASVVRRYIDDCFPSSPPRDDADSPYETP
jgi:hypothetical protein